MALVLRSYRLPEPVHLPAAPAYAGCRSWVPLERPVAVEGEVEDPCPVVVDRHVGVRPAGKLRIRKQRVGRQEPVRHAPEVLPVPRVPP
ncbi:MAG: DUF1802 family protein [candidate division NC10 bacterium]